jgi:hypothetical protein
MLNLCCHLRQFSNMQDFSASDGSNVRLGEREQRNCPTFSGQKLDLESRAIFVAVHHGPYIAFF